MPSRCGLERMAALLSENRQHCSLGWALGKLETSRGFLVGYRLCNVLRLSGPLPRALSSAFWCRSYRACVSWLRPFLSACTCPCTCAQCSCMHVPARVLVRVVLCPRCTCSSACLCVWCSLSVSCFVWCCPTVCVTPFPPSGKHLWPGHLSWGSSSCIGFHVTFVIITLWRGVIYGLADG